jgi:YihY family inner membrane protein
VRRALSAFISIGGVSLWLTQGYAWAASDPRFGAFVTRLSVDIVGFLLSMTLFFVIFRYLPNIRMPIDTVIRASIFTGVVWELGKNVFVWRSKAMDLSAIYGAYFTAAVVLILWSYVSAMIMIIGAELAHRELLSLRLFQPAYEEWRLLRADNGGPV